MPMMPTALRYAVCLHLALLILSACSEAQHESRPATLPGGQDRPTEDTPTPQVIEDPIDAPGAKPYPYIPLKPLIDGQAIVEAATVECADPNDCPESVGLLIGSNGREIFQCSTTYIGNGHFSTNSHCLPDNLIQGDALFKSCDHAIWVKLPKTPNSPATTLHCSQIVSATKKNENLSADESRDALIFKVQETVPRLPAVVDWQRPPGFGKTLTFWPADPVHHRPGIHGLIRKKTCTVDDPRHLKEILYGFKLHNVVSHLGHCSPQIVGGNSGSSAFFDGSASAIVSHRKYAEDGLAANYACLPGRMDQQGEFSRMSRDKCRFIPKHSEDELRQYLRDQEADQILNRLHKILHSRGLMETTHKPEIVEFDGANAYVPLYASYASMRREPHPRDFAVKSEVGGDIAFSGAQLPDVVIERLILPSCLSHPELWMEEQQEKKGWPWLSIRTWLPLDVDVELGPRVIDRYSFRKESLDPHDAKDMAVVPTEHVETALNFTAKLHLTDFYDSATKKAKAPKIQVTLQSKPMEGAVDPALSAEGPLARKVIDHLLRLPLCEE